MMNTYLLTTEDFDPRTLPEQAVLYAHLLTRDAMKDELVCKLMAAPRFVRSDRGIPYAVLKDMRTHHWTLIRAWREYLEIKRERLATRLGISVAEYNVIEKGQAPLSRTMVALLAQGMGLDETQLQMSPYQPVLNPLTVS
ncbi:helix-turn-helix transcriptional regulator [Alcaligenes sp. SORT26]|uniref:helix-turn-helix domain-containing protein n=1 Tax=Alcaligenes sp. SORT26 TaxID=2813780 RepID=UPI001A9DF1CF|nr:helix-turn-helix transcriptional regulator [Alcaligenes sp. SORT26]QTB98650.1 helix-turn-helix transcriptional regulator [Alcaligenes sp. SORT26]